MMVTKKNRFYNAEIKEKYLKGIENEGTRHATTYPFIKSKKTEEDFNKDIYEMNINELGLVMSEMQSSSVDSAYVNASRLEQYIKWAYENELLDSNLNPISNLADKREWASKYVSTYRQTALTREQLLDMCSILKNEVDQALLLALFEGIVGKGYSELLNLRAKDLKENNNTYTATLYDSDKTERTIEITKELYKLLLQADSQDEYINKNGEATMERTATSKFEDSPYIFKKTTRGKQGGRLDLFYVNRKFTMFKEVFDMRFLKAKNVEISGIMHMAHEMYSKKNELTNDDIKKIADHYNTSTIEYKGDEQRSTTVIKNILKSDLFKNLYKYEIIK